eukprot:m.311250 g.311250  ORF g.311250 m.311250 type:complete len:377 (-) comp19651_c1_seq8:27-1157(-)
MSKRMRLGGDERPHQQGAALPAAAPCVRGELPHELAGRRAESELHRALVGRGLAVDAVVGNLRVPLWHRLPDRTPRETSGGFVLVSHAAEEASRLARGEIDLCVLTQRGIFVIEVKNWSGSCVRSAQGRSWLQYRSNGEVIDHKDAVETTGEKARCFAEHLMRQGCRITPAHVLPRVVFVNSRLCLDESIASLPEVVTPDNVEQLLQSFDTTALRAIGDAWLPTWLTGCTIASDVICEVKAAIEWSVGTWDVVELRNADDGELHGHFLGVGAGDDAPLLQVDRLTTASLEMTSPSALQQLWHGSHSVVVISKERSQDYVSLLAAMTSVFASVVDAITPDVLARFGSEAYVALKIGGHREASRVPLSLVKAVRLSRL